MRQIIQERGSGNLVYVDESGFEPDAFRPYGWGRKGEKVYGEHSGNRRPRTSVIAAHRGKILRAPMLFEGTAKTELVNDWTEKMLLKELRPDSTIIWDHAAFHSKTALEAIAEKQEHPIPFLPPYSPDFNPIQQDWAVIKKQRQAAPPHTPLDLIIASYGNYSE